MSDYAVRLTHSALNDLRTIRAYVADRGSPETADSLIQSLNVKIEALASFPLRGAVPKELEAFGVRRYRQIIVGPYRLLHRVIGQDVFVSLVADGRRDMQRLLERRLLGR